MRQSVVGSSVDCGEERLNRRADDIIGDASTPGDLAIGHGDADIRDSLRGRAFLQRMFRIGQVGELNSKLGLNRIGNSVETAIAFSGDFLSSPFTLTVTTVWMVGVRVKW